MKAASLLFWLAFGWFAPFCHNCTVSKVNVYAVHTIAPDICIGLPGSSKTRRKSN